MKIIQLSVVSMLLLGFAILTLATDPEMCPSSVHCPKKNSTYTIQLPDPDDCSSFCKCVDDKAFLVHCPKGLLYNSKLEVCDYPSNVNCNDNNATAEVNQHQNGIAEFFHLLLRSNNYKDSHVTSG